MKKFIEVIITTAVVVSIILGIGYLLFYFKKLEDSKYTIEQKKSAGGLFIYEPTLVTYVRHKDEILMSWYDSVNTKGDSIGEIRLKDAETFIEKCKKLTNVKTE